MFLYDAVRPACMVKDHSFNEGPGKAVRGSDEKNIFKKLIGPTSKYEAFLTPKRLLL